MTRGRSSLGLEKKRQKSNAMGKNTIAIQIPLEEPACWRIPVKYPAETQKKKTFDDLVKGGKIDLLTEINKGGGGYLCRGTKGQHQEEWLDGSGQSGGDMARTDDGNGTNDTGTLRNVQPAVPVRAERYWNTGNTGTEKGGLNNAGKENGRGYNQGTRCCYGKRQKDAYRRKCRRTKRNAG